MTRQKTRYLLGLADDVLDGRLDLAALDGLDDETVRERLSAVVGIGRWTSDIYLVMALRRPDIWPLGDLALASALRRAKALAVDPARGGAAGDRDGLGAVAGGRGADPVARLPRRRALTATRRTMPCARRRLG